MKIIVKSLTREKAEILNEFFIRVGPNLAKNIKKPSNSVGNRTVKDSIFIQPTNLIEVSQIIDKLDKNTKSGVDGINVKLIQIIKKFILKPLTYIINLSITSGIFPTVFKEAEIVHIYKTGLKNLCTNYRPISLISNFTKIFEKVLKERILNFLKKNKIISEKQFGFIENSSTNDAVANVTKFIYDNLDNSSPTVIFLDLKKAFDTVDHNLLISKLKNIGIRDIAKNLVASYLNHRTQYVRLNNVSSHSKIVECGVPQGTVLGPLLFIIYLNDLLSCVDGLISFADDTVIMSKAKTWIELETLLNENMKCVMNWLSYNKLSLNKEKTVYITFTNHDNKQPDELKISIHDTDCNTTCYCDTISRVNYTKYLGITIDKSMRWTEHLNNICKKSRYILYMFHKIKNYLTRNQLLTLYFGLFLSYVTYGLIGWGGAYSTLLDKLQRVQDKLFKILYCKKPIRSSDKQPILLSIHQYYCYESLKQNIYKLTFSYSQKNVKITRNPQLTSTLCHNKVGQKNNYYCANTAFNKKESNIKNVLSIICKKKVNSKNKLKKILKLWCVSNLPYSKNEKYLIFYRYKI